MIESHLFAGYLVLLRDVFQTPTVLSTKGQRSWQSGQRHLFKARYEFNCPLTAGHPTKEVAVTLRTDAAVRNEKLATQGEKGTSRTDELHQERVSVPRLLFACK